MSIGVQISLKIIDVITGYTDLIQFHGGNTIQVH